MPNHYQDPTSNPTQDDARIGDYSMVQVGDIWAIDVREHFPDRRTAQGDFYKGRPLDSITTLIIHHEGQKYVGTSTVADLDRISAVYSYHLNEPTTHLWPGLAYHFMLSPTTGNLYLTGSPETIRYHATQANPYSIGVCIMGNWEGDTPYAPDLQDLLFKRLKIVVDNIQKGLGKPLTILGHKEISQTGCPGDWWGPEISNWFNTMPPGETEGHPKREGDHQEAGDIQVPIGVPENSQPIVVPAMPERPIGAPAPIPLTEAKIAIVEKLAQAAQKLQEAAVMVAQLP